MGRRRSPGDEHELMEICIVGLVGCKAQKEGAFISMPLVS